EHPKRLPLKAPPTSKAAVRQAHKWSAIAHHFFLGARVIPGIRYDTDAFTLASTRFPYARRVILDFWNSMPSELRTASLVVTGTLTAAAIAGIVALVVESKR